MPRVYIPCSNGGVAEPWRMVNARAVSCVLHAWYPCDGLDFGTLGCLACWLPTLDCLYQSDQGFPVISDVCRHMACSCVLKVLCFFRQGPWKLEPQTQRESWEANQVGGVPKSPSSSHPIPSPHPSLPPPPLPPSLPHARTTPASLFLQRV